MSGLTLAVTRPMQGVSSTMSLEVSLEIPEGILLALTGPSGSGKTTLLRIIAGLEEATGSIQFAGEPWLEGLQALPPQKRQVGFVFQEYALFENMTVEGNLLYVRNDRELMERLLAMIRLGAFRDRYPATLSGGQKQRVALARAMMHRPKLLLMDEPLSALDPKMRAFLREKIVEVHREFGMTTILVSHDVQEVAQMADRVIRLEQGKVVSDGEADFWSDRKISGELLAFREEDGRMRLKLQTSEGVVEIEANRS